MAGNMAGIEELLSEAITVLTHLAECEGGCNEKEYDALARSARRILEELEESVRRLEKTDVSNAKMEIKIGQAKLVIYCDVPYADCACYPSLFFARA